MPEPGTLDSRIRVTSYVADAVYRLRGYVGYQIDLEFEAGESFIGIGAGDLESITFAAQANHLFLKPKAPGVDTNLTVLTSQRAYHFDYIATARRPDPDDRDVIYVLRFTYPAPPATQDADSVGRNLAAAAAAAPRNLEYWYCGNPSLKPAGAWDDGVQTHLRFGARQELPAIFLRNEDGTESLVNTTIEGADVIVHRLAHRLIVRRGGLTGCIVNATFTGGGERAPSGTIVPTVERATREVRP